MNPSAIAALAQAVDSEQPREQRARSAAAVVRAAGTYRGVAIYDVGDDELSLLAGAGSSAANPRSDVGQEVSGEAVRTRATVMRGPQIAVPVLGAETGIVIGTLAVETDGAQTFSRGEIEFLEECAGVLRPLYD